MAMISRAIAQVVSCQIIPEARVCLQASPRGICRGRRDNDRPHDAGSKHLWNVGNALQDWWDFIKTLQRSFKNNVNATDG